MCDACTNLRRAIDAYIAKAKGDLDDDLKSEGYLESKSTVDAAEEIEDELAERMNDDTRHVVEELSKADTVDEFLDGTWELIQQSSALADDIQEVFEQGFQSIIPKLVNAYLQETDMYLVADSISLRTAAWIQEWSAGLGKLMQLTSHEKLGDILSTGLRDGKSVAEITDRIMDAGIRSNYTRARSTALTEMLTAHSVARNEGLMQSPVVEGKEWKHSGFRRNKARPNHVAMDGTVVKKTEKFELYGEDGGIYYPEYPRDTILPASERVFCHCLHRGIVDQSVLGLSLDERRQLQAQSIADMDTQWLAELDERNRARAGIDDPMRAINSLLPNANAGHLKPTQTLNHRSSPPIAAANAVVDVLKGDGKGASRYIYDAAGKVILRIDTTDHGNPKWHPFGNNGAHYVRALYDENGEFVKYGKNMALTAKMRRLCRDLLKPDTIQ